MQMRKREPARNHTLSFLTLSKYNAPMTAKTGDRKTARTKTKNEEKYFITAAANMLDLVGVLEDSREELGLTDLSRAVGLSSNTTFRLLHTLEQKGWVTRSGRRFRWIHRRGHYRIGYAMLTGQSPYAEDVTRGLKEEADRKSIELIVADNCYNPDIALMNARMFVNQRVDLVIECQSYEKVAPVISEMFSEARIPVLAVDIPLPGAIFFGANNYRAGLIAGRALADYAERNWEGKVDKLILLELPQSGPIPMARMTGTLNGLREHISVSPDDVIELDGGARWRAATTLCGAFSRPLSGDSRLLIATINDASAVGAVRALEAGGRTSGVVVVGQNATLEARQELRREGSLLLGSVGYFPERYGSQIMPLALQLLEGVQVAPAYYIEHVMVDASNVDQFYPSDPPLGPVSGPGQEAIRRLSNQAEASSFFLRLSAGRRRDKGKVMKKTTRCLLLMLVAGCLTAWPAAQSQPFPMNGWQFHDYDLPKLEEAIRRAPSYGVNFVIFSHGLFRSVEGFLASTTTPIRPIRRPG